MGRSACLGWNVAVWACVVIVIMLSVTGAWAQTGTTSIHGTVMDKSGGTIAVARVSLMNAAQGLQRGTGTNAAGEYEFVGLQPGTYALAVEAPGFRKYEQTNIQLLVNLPATVNVTMDVGSSSQTVEVSVQAEALNTTDASLGNAFNENQVKQLPLEGRNVPDLLSLQPGVAYTGNRSDVPAMDTRSGAVNGARSDQSNVTLDGVPVNDEGGKAFTSVLPVTLDSVQEFRVTTTNYNADQGSSSGAQVALVTKSGTNSFHGSAYEYNRDTYTSANDYFVKATQEDSGQPNTPPKLIRNIFGGSLGGPIKKDRLYFFTNYEATRRVEATSQTDVVPSPTLRDGIMQYQCATPSACPGGTVTGLSGASYPVQAGFMALSPSQLTAIDPLHLGPSAAVVKYLNTWPSSNCNSVGDGVNYDCFNFAAPITDTDNVYIAKLDYNITRDAKHRVSVSGSLNNDNHAFAPFLPGEAPQQDVVDYSKGIVTSYSAVLTSDLVNNFRYGFVRQSVGTIGNSNQDWIFFRGLNDQAGAITRTSAFQRPTNNFIDDVSWIRGKHTWQFGTQVQIAREPRQSDFSSFSDGIANASWVNTSGYANKTGSPLNPANNGLPAVDPSFDNSYDYPLQALLGMVTEVDAKYNFTKSGSALPDGTPLTRRFGLDSYEFYAQDIWKIKPTLTVTLGLRYSLFSPPWETNGVQVNPNVSLSNLLTLRGNEGANGIPSSMDPPISFNFSGPANGKPDYYNWDYGNLGPRVAFAWAPRFSDGLFRDVFGEGKTSVRGGFGIVYDRFGQGIVDDFDRSGSFGLSSTLTNPAGVQTVSSAPRLTSVNTIPTTDNSGNPIFLPAPASTFPQTFPTGTFAIATGLDTGLKTPYEYTLDFSIGRELKGGMALEVSYVGRLSHRLLTQEDAATPLDLRDKASGIDYFTAVDALAKLYRQGSQGGAGVTDATFSNSMLPANVVKYWQDMIGTLAPPSAANGGAGGAYALGSSGGCGAGPSSTTNPVLAAFDLFCGSNLNETTGLFDLDFAGIPDANNPNNVYFPTTGQYSFYNPQYATLYAWRSMGMANYNALQVTLKHRMSRGIQFDFNYTFSKSIDLASDAERVGNATSSSPSGGLGSQIINAWDPYQFRAVSDFDATHQFNADWVADLPFGRGSKFRPDANKALNAVIGGWQLSGLFRITSGFPFSVGNGAQWPTDWDLPGNAYQTGPVQTGVFHNPADPSVVNAFSNFSSAQASFVEPLPGQAGVRNTLRGDGYFSIDMGLSKRWIMPWAEKQSLQFRWEVFNISNSVRFDAQSINASVDTFGSTFGQYTRLSTNPRVMQFALRYEF
jgi:hypothetical protein